MVNKIFHIDPDDKEVLAATEELIKKSKKNSD